MKGFQNVFSFTLRQCLRTRSYRGLTVGLAVALFLLPVLGMCVAEHASAGKAAAVYTPPETVYCADESAGQPAQVEILRTMEGFEQTNFVLCADAEAALNAAGERDLTLLLGGDGAEGFRLQVVLPENAALTEDDAQWLCQSVEAHFSYLSAGKSGLTAEQLQALSVPVRAQSAQTQQSGDGFDGLREALSFILPYGNVMLLYFLVLFYGQSIAACVVLEKNSKLMDTLLVSVEPKAMVFGKVFAVALSCVIQLGVWVVCLVGGFVAGNAAVLSMNPESHMLLVRFFRYMGGLSGLVQPVNVLLAVLLVVAGFLMYCAMAAIGGALASKQEELATTNSAFTLVLVASFLVTLWSGVLSGTAERAWVDFVPFTSVLLTPSRILLGIVPVGAALGSLAVTVVFSCALLVLAGRIYKVMALYRGEPPKPQRLLAMLRGK